MITKGNAVTKARVFGHLTARLGCLRLNRHAPWCIVIVGTSGKSFQESHSFSALRPLMMFLEGVQLRSVEVCAIGRNSKARTLESVQSMHWFRFCFVSLQWGIKFMFIILYPLYRIPN